MAAELGARSLAAVHQEGLDEILHGLATLHPASPDHDPAQLLGVPVLDALLQVFMSKTTIGSSYTPAHGQFGPSERPVLSREQQRAEDAEMLFQGDPDPGDPSTQEQPPLAHPGVNRTVDSLIPDPKYGTKQSLPVVEISSSFSAAGKSQLLYYLTALAVLPSRYGDIPVGGQDAAVIYFDTDGRFDAERLREVARGIVLQQQNRPISGADRDGLEPLLVSCLQHVHIFRPQSSSSLLATLRVVETYLFDLSRHRSASLRVHLIVLDSATAFFWQDRLRDEVARTEDIGRPRGEIEQEHEQKQSFYLSDLYAELARELKRVQRRLGCAIIFTSTISSGRPPQDRDSQPPATSGPFDPGLPTSRSPSLRPALPAPWGTFPTLRLIVHRDSVRPFPPTMSVSDAEKEAPLRQAVVHQGKVSVCVNAWGREDWPRRVVDGVAANNRGSFSFHVFETGVDLPS